MAGVEGAHFDGEFVVAWTGDDGRENDPAGEEIFGYGYDHSYVLAYTATGTE